MSIIKVAGTSIQVAHDKAMPGDTLELAPGGYAPFVVSKNVTIAGNGSAYIEGPGNTVQVKSPATLRGVEVRGSTGRYNSCILVTAPDVTLEDVWLHHGESFGVRAYGAVVKRLTMLRPKFDHLAAGVEFNGGGAGSRVEDAYSTDLDRMIVNDTTPSNDTGGMFIAFNKSTGPIDVVNALSRYARATSIDYGVDGAHFEAFGGAKGVRIIGGSFEESPWFLETGRNATQPDNADFIVRGVKVWGNKPHVDSHNVASHGFLLRSMVGMVIEDSEFVELDWHTILAEQKSNYVGSVSGIVVKRNKVWLKPGDDRWVTLGVGVPSTAFDIDENTVYPQGSTAVASVYGKGKTTSKDQLTSWTGWEANSYWGPEQTEVQRLTAERDAALALAAVRQEQVDQLRTDLVFAVGFREKAEAESARLRGIIERAAMEAAA